MNLHDNGRIEKKDVNMKEFHVTSSQGADLVTPHPSVAADTFVRHIPNGFDVGPTKSEIERSLSKAGNHFVRSCLHGDEFVTVKTVGTPHA